MHFVLIITSALFWTEASACWNFILIHKICFEYTNKELYYVSFTQESFQNLLKHLKVQGIAFLQFLVQLKRSNNCICVEFYLFWEIEIMQMRHCLLRVGKCFIMPARCMICLSCLFLKVLWIVYIFWNKMKTTF